MDAKIKQILKYSLSLCLAGALLYFSFRGVDWKQFAAGIRNCNWLYVIISMCCGAMAFVLRGLRWRMLLKPLNPTTDLFTPINAINMGNLANMVFPYLGELVRCGVVSKKKTPFDKVLGTIALERVWDLISLIVIALIIALFGWDIFGDFFTDKIIEPLTSGQANRRYLIIAILLASGAAAVLAVMRLKDRNAFTAKIWNFLKGLADGFSSWLRMDNKMLFLLLTAVIWAQYWLQMVFISAALPEINGIGLMDALFLMLAGSIASVVPVPGGFGAYHYLMATALSSIFGYSWATGIVFATVAHESQAITMILTGTGSYIAETVRTEK